MAEISIKEASYQGDRTNEGFISGTITVITEGGPDELYVYPAKNGRPLEDWTFLSHSKCTGDETVITIPRNLMTPVGADSLTVTAKKGTDVSEEYVIELPVNITYIERENASLKFQVVSDLHVTGDPGHDHDRHFLRMLDDIIEVCPDSKGVMVVGDVADNGRQDQYEAVYSMIESRPDAPDFWYVHGNHDMASDYNEQIRLFNEFAGNDSAYYDIWLGGCHFIFIEVGDCGCSGAVSKKELDWLRETIAVSASPDRPIFLFCHQSIMDTVAGSMKAEGWYGISNGKQVAEILAEYPQATFFNGHSHWLLSSYNEMYTADDRMCNAFNTSSVGYLWTGFNKVEGEYEYGSEGLYVEVYDDIIMVRGRDFENNLWNAASQYAVTLPGFSAAIPAEETEETVITESVQSVKTDNIKSSGLSSPVKAVLGILGALVLAAAVCAAAYKIVKNKK